MGFIRAWSRRFDIIYNLENPEEMLEIIGKFEGPKLVDTAVNRPGEKIKRILSKTLLQIKQCIKLVLSY